MFRAEWPWLLVALILMVGLPLTLQWMGAHAPGSGHRRFGWSIVVAWTVGLAATLLQATAVDTRTVLSTLVAGELIAVALGITAARYTGHERRVAGRQLLSTENLTAGPAHLRIRPHASAAPVAQAGNRLERWLATDGPTPTGGWWLNAALTQDSHGIALIDAAGLRHPLPTATVSMLHRRVPDGIYLVDGRDAVLAQLPVTGFTDPDLRHFCLAVGWHYRENAVLMRRAAHAIDLRRAVIDEAAAM